MRGVPCVAVAYSGGRDSTALLHATLVMAGPLGLRVLALHVHHGLSPNADAWLAHCAAQCGRWARRGQPIEFVARRLATQPGAGESVEAWARQERYRALRGMALAQGASIVLLAQHRRDQAETLLLQALRGAGVAGLAGMPRLAQREGLDWARPWLGEPPEAIDAYLRRYRLKPIEDESNADPRFARNRLRLKVWPALMDSFAHAEAALAAAADWAQEAAAALAELAALDLTQVADAHGLALDRWMTLSPARRSNALRAWLKAQLGAPAAAALASRLAAELQPRRGARWPAPGGELRSYRGTLRLVPDPLPAAVADQRETVLSVRRAGTYLLPGWAGRLQVTRVKEGGVPLAWLAHIELRARQGAERFQAGIGRPPRSLKKQFQSAGVPMWERDGPLLYSGGQLVYVPGLGIDARVVGLPGQVLVGLRWMPLAMT